MTMLMAALPFAGFYGFQHDADLNYALEAMFCNDQGDSCPGLTTAPNLRWLFGHAQTPYSKLEFCDLRFSA